MIEFLKSFFKDSPRFSIETAPDGFLVTERLPSAVGPDIRVPVAFASTTEKAQRIIDHMTTPIEEHQRREKAKSDERVAILMGKRP